MKVSIWGRTDSKYVLESVGRHFLYSIAQECVGCHWEALCILNSRKACEELLHTFLEMIPLDLS